MRVHFFGKCGPGTATDYRKNPHIVWETSIERQGEKKKENEPELSPRGFLETRCVVSISKDLQSSEDPVAPKDLRHPDLRQPFIPRNPPAFKIVKTC